MQKIERELHKKIEEQMWVHRTSTLPLSQRLFVHAFGKGMVEIGKDGQPYVSALRVTKLSGENWNG